MQRALSPLFRVIAWTRHNGASPTPLACATRRSPVMCWKHWTRWRSARRVIGHSMGGKNSDDARRHGFRNERPAVVAVYIAPVPYRTATTLSPVHCVVSIRTLV